MANVYYSPEKWDLKVVGEVEFSDASYQFDTLIVWEHASGKLYMARSSGCSCPTPFEEFQSLADLEQLTDYVQLEREVRGSHSSSSHTSSMGVSAFLSKVKQAMYKVHCAECGSDALDGDYLCCTCRHTLV